MAGQKVLVEIDFRQSSLGNVQRALKEIDDLLESIDVKFIRLRSTKPVKTYVVYYIIDNSPNLDDILYYITTRYRCSVKYYFLI